MRVVQGRPGGAAVLLWALAAMGGARGTAWAQSACNGGWFGLAGGVNDVALALAALPGGGLVVGGTFITADGVGVEHIARWDGSWHTMSGGTSDGVSALAVLPGGDVVVGGSFTAVGAGGVVSASKVARWDGSAWYPLGTGVNDAVYALAALPSGGVIAGGSFTVAGGGGASYIARWDGSAWSPLGAGTNSYVRAVAVMPNGDVIAAGDFTAAGGSPASRIARWDGSAWSALGAGVSAPAYALAVMPNGDLMAGGGFTAAGGAPAKFIARWDGGAWSAVGSGMNSVVSALTVLGSGGLVAGGAFTNAGGVAAAKIARWDGAAWAPLGSGLTGAVNALAALDDGDLAACGFFISAGSVSARRLARWTDEPVLPPAVTLQPAPSTVCGGGGAVYSVACDGTAPLAYRWQMESPPVGSGAWGDLFDGPFNGGAATAAGVTTTTLTISGAQPGAATRFRCRAWNSCGTVNSDAAALAVVQPASVTGQPMPQSACAGGSAGFAVTAAGDGPVTYRWQIEALPAGSGVWADLSDGPINASAAMASGSGTPALAVGNVQPAGASRYRCVVSNACGSVSSAAAALTLLTVATADFNHSGATTLQDIFDFLTAWFAGLASADFNGSGAVTVQDIFDFLVAWFARC